MQIFNLNRNYYCITAFKQT